MKKSYVLCLYTFLALNLFAGIKVSYVLGVVQSRVSSASQWSPVAAGDNLSEGDLIFTGFNSKAVLEYNNIKIEVRPLSQMKISSLLSDEKKTVSDIQLKYGQIKADVKKIENVKTNFRVRSANTTASVRGTSFVFGNDKLTVLNGTVKFESVLFDSYLVQRGEVYEYLSDDFKLRGNPERLNLIYRPTARPLGLSDENDSPYGYSYMSNGSDSSGLLISFDVIR